MLRKIAEDLIQELVNVEWRGHDRGFQVYAYRGSMLLRRSRRAGKDEV